MEISPEGKKVEDENLWNVGISRRHLSRTSFEQEPAGPLVIAHEYILLVSSSEGGWNCLSVGVLKVFFFRFEI